MPLRPRSLTSHIITHSIHVHFLELRRNASVAGEVAQGGSHVVCHGLSPNDPNDPNGPNVRSEFEAVRSLTEEVTSLTEEVKRCTKKLSRMKWHKQHDIAFHLIPTDERQRAEIAQLKEQLDHCHHVKGGPLSLLSQHCKMRCLGTVLLFWTVPPKLRFGDLWNDNAGVLSPKVSSMKTEISCGAMCCSCCESPFSSPKVKTRSVWAVAC